MTSSHDERYKELLREQIRGGPGGQRKKRRVNRTEEEEVIVIDSDEAPEQSTTIESNGEEKEGKEEDEDDDDDDDDDDSDDFEDVDLEDQQLPQDYGLLGEQTKENDNETLTFALEQNKDVKQVKRKFIPISKEEREMRRSYHQLLVACMIIHGAIRNMWCNDYHLSLQMKRMVSPQVKSLLFPLENDGVLETVRARRFLDGLQKLMRTYGHKFRTTSQGIIRKNWNELSIPQQRREKNVDLDRFKLLVSNYRGSRDIGAQGFVALLRSIGLIARLVFSLQPPDYTSTASYPVEKKPPVTKPKPNQIIQKFGNNKANLLSAARSSVVASTETEEVKTLESSSYPVFWVEVWNKYAKKWVSIDPIVLETLEYAPTRKKSSFEPPLTETRNQLHYVIAYDRMGGVKDVTRRYSQYYNARAVKKKIQFRSVDDEIWYQRILRSVTSPIRQKPSKLDILESLEFYNRDRAEGMPNNVADFKNHPTYALETQLKQNEVIYPKDQTSKCGLFRNKSTRSKKNNEVIPVYKRTHVHLLRSAKAWYMRGRVLKVGAQALKLKKNNKKDQSTGSDDEEEEFTRLYAEFQTELFEPQPIVDGIIPKNVYGNIDVYTPTMLPENGCLVSTTGSYTMKMAEKAARILDIDYARAIIAFDFGKNGEKRTKASTRVPTAKEGGVVVHEEYEEAMMAILESLLEEELEYQRNAVRFNSFKNWRYFLTKLRISERLNRQHGKIEKIRDEKAEEANDDEENDDVELNFSVYDSSGSDLEINEKNDVAEDMDEGGGFLVAHEERESEAGPILQLNEISDMLSIDEDGGGGFFVEESPQLTERLSDHPILSDQEDIPDTLFRMGDDGELIYDPEKEERNSEIGTELAETDNGPTTQTLPSLDVPDGPAGRYGESANLNMEQNFDTKPYFEDGSEVGEKQRADNRSANIPSETESNEDKAGKDEIDETNEKIQNDEFVYESDDKIGDENLIESSVESSDERAIKLDPQEESQLMEEENEFGFQYSDSE